MVPRGPWVISEGVESFGMELGTDFDYVEMPWYTDDHKFASETGWSLAVSADSNRHYNENQDMQHRRQHNRPNKLFIFVRSFFRMVFFLPCIAPMVATSVVFARSILPTTTGFLNMMLNRIGLPSVNWLGDLHCSSSAQ